MSLGGGLIGELEYAKNADAGGTISQYDYLYDTARNLLWEVQQLRPLNYQAVDFLYGRDLLGNVTQVDADLPGTDDDYRNTYQYDHRGRTTEVGQTAIGEDSLVSAKTVTFAYEYITGFLTTKIRRYDADVATGSPTIGTYQRTYGNGAVDLINHARGGVPSVDVNSYTISRHSLWYDPHGLVAYQRTDAREDGMYSDPVTTTTDYTYDNYAQLTQAATTRTGQDPQTQDFEYDDNGNRLGDDIGLYNRLNASASARAHYFYDNEGNVQAKWNYELIERVDEPGGFFDSFVLQSTWLYAGVYRMVFSDVTVSMETFDVVLWDLEGTGEELCRKTVTATDAGDGTYRLDTTLDFELTESHNPGSFLIRFGEGWGSVIIFSGEVDLEKFQSRMGFEWDYRNRLTKAKYYTDTYYPSGDTVTVTFPEV
ncbi:MAG TPA: hypothetical protein VMY42_21900, partial [Thermoguttaceae bacterium]|nr:hypothetical protein [Thermoguttaceae bacterium]